jgi:hypothetical protein
MDSLNKPSIEKFICDIEEYAITFFKSIWLKATCEAYIKPIKLKIQIKKRTSLLISKIKQNDKRKIAYIPNLILYQLI